MKVALGTFARSGIEARFGSASAAGVEAALRHYTRRLKSRRMPVAVPTFFRGQTPASAVTEYELSVGPEIEAALKLEALRQGIPIDLLLSHAVFVYLADLDASADDGAERSAEEDTRTPRFPEDESLPTEGSAPARKGRSSGRKSPIAAGRGSGGAGVRFGSRDRKR